jgi:hypothetical protein
MERCVWLSLGTVLLASTLVGGPIEYRVTNIGPTTYRYTYSLTGLTILRNQELDIQFAPTYYAALSNGVAGDGFDLELLLPNNPPGAPGHYSAVALADNPSLAGPFAVDVTFIGPGTPGGQVFFLNQLDSSGTILSVVDGGITTPGAVTAPEPNYWAAWGVVLTCAAVSVFRRPGSRARGWRLDLSAIVRSPGQRDS